MDGIAISVYDKFEELSVVVNLIKKEWENDYYVTVCCTHPDGQQEIKSRNIPIDTYIQGGQIPFNRDMEGDKYSFYLRSRIVNSIGAACQETATQIDGYLMHLHADAWPLSESKFLKIKKNLQERNRVAAVRGYGLEWRESCDPFGHVMDQFFLIDANFSMTNNVFDIDPVKCLPHMGIHSMLLFLFLKEIGIENLWWYSRMEEDLVWDGTQVDLPYTGVRPGVYNPDWKFLHIATDEFPENDGLALQAYYLNQNGPYESEAISRFINEYYDPNIISRLQQYENKLDSCLRKYGYKPRRFGRVISAKERYVNDIEERSDIKNLGIKLINNIKNIGEYIPKALNMILPNDLKIIISPEAKDYHSARWFSVPGFYPDSGWPDDRITDRYCRIIEQKDFDHSVDHWYMPPQEQNKQCNDQNQG